MSHYKCSVKGCTTTGERYFRFPNPSTNPERCLKWLSVVGNADLLSIPSNNIVNRRVCRLHFEDKYVLPRYLHPTAVPSLYLPSEPIDVSKYNIIKRFVPDEEEPSQQTFAVIDLPDEPPDDRATESANMSKGRLMTRSVTDTRPVEMTLNLDCIEDSLSEAQQMTRLKIQENYEKVMAKLEELVKDHGAQKVLQAGPVSGYHYTLPGTKKVVPTLSHAPGLPLTVNQNKGQPLKLNVLNNSQNSSSQGNIQLLMNPRLILAQGNTPTTASSTMQPSPGINQSENFQRRPVRRMNTVQIPQQQQQQQKPDAPEPQARNRGNKTTSVVHNAATSKGNVSGNATMANARKAPPKPPPPPPPAPAAPTQLPPWPKEQTSIGGIAVGMKNAVGDQIDETKKNQPDGREISFNKMNGGRTFPSLVVVARPHLRTKDITPAMSQKERSDLDLRVKSVLMYGPTKFAEWLIQKGLVRSEQFCSLHSTTQHKSKLKLGMYSDSAGTFPYSGGYVWLSTCCSDRYVSVFCGSIFQASPHVPNVLLKLIYHWACQTNVQNVVSWVRVSNVYVKHFFTMLRSICTAAISDKARIMGGKGSVIQVGVISLGTTSQDGNLRQVKVEVLGVLNPDTLEIRLRACEPLYDGDRSFKRRFNNILHPLKEWVHKDSKIITDYTVDRGTLLEMGFTQVVQTAFTEQNSRNNKSNYHVMEYLRKIVPRMFQNTLSLLSRPMIQQFLDELVWREMFGATATRAFDNIMLHIAEQTRTTAPEGLTERLAKIAANPFKDWAYSKKPVVTERESPTTITLPQGKPGPRRGKKRPANSTASPEPEAKRAANDEASRGRDDDSSRSEQIQLDEFYYATMEGDQARLAAETKSTCSFKCFLCPTTMKCNTDVMAHMISHVPARVPGQRESAVCQYCCAAFSSNHQMVIHVSEAHTKFGQSDAAGDMVVCAICEEKFFVVAGNGSLLINHLGNMHYPSEMPYQCESCDYRTSSHKDVIDHYYSVHEKGEGLQCPYCLKVMPLMVDGRASASNVHAYLVHMQRHIVRREQGRGNKCSRCCLWFNQKSALKRHQEEAHRTITGSRVSAYTKNTAGIVVPRSKLLNVKRLDIEKAPREYPDYGKIEEWPSGPISVLAPSDELACQECEEDIDESDHYPGEQQCQHCRYATCCWRAFNEHQRQIHNERPMTSLVVPAPLINIPLERKMQCSCETFSTCDGNLLAAHLVSCERTTAYPVDRIEQKRTGMLDSLGLVPKAT